MYSEYRVQWADDQRNAGISLSSLQLYHEFVEWCMSAPLDDVIHHARCEIKPTSPVELRHGNAAMRYWNILFRRLSMARGKSKNQQKHTQQIEFVSVRLDDDDKSRLAEADEPLADEIVAQIQSWIDEGYKISVNMTDSGSVNFTLTCKDPDHENHGRALSGWGDSFLTAYMSFHYKHTYKCAGIWESTSKTTGTAKFG